jgi:hypothetical protein
MKWLRRLMAPKVAPDTDYTGIFAIPNDTPWWLAVHQLLNEAEHETVEGARSRTANPNLCIAAVGAGEGVDLVRQKLIDKRRLALQNANTIQSGGKIS